MPPPQAIDIESLFSSEELFFSRTDAHGVILAGNQVFARVSEYERAKMIQHPHNLVRHPDMPKAVFKVFWDGLLKNDVMTAYVKNMSSSGKYYWVLATVFPVSDGFISIRIKPSSPLFQITQNLYVDVLAYEKKNGMNATVSYLIEKLNEKGFADYSQFMREALKTELFERSKKATASEEKISEIELSDPFERHILQSKRYAEESLEVLKSIFTRIYASEQSSKNFIRMAHEVSQSYQRIHLLSINMITEAERIGESGRTLTVISETFSKWAKDIQQSIELFSRALEDVSHELSRLIFAISTTQLQAEMVAFFMKEYFTHVNDSEEIRISREELQTNCFYFLSAPELVFQEVQAQLNSLSQKVLELERANSDLRYGLNALKMIRQNGKIETSRLAYDQQGYNHHLEGMKEFTDRVEAVSDQIAQAANELNGNVRYSRERLSSVGQSFVFAAKALKAE